MHFVLACLLGLAAVPVASAQPVRAVAEDGRAVLLFEDHVWVAEADAVDGLRTGTPDSSATGRFVVHVPAEWSSSPPTGEMLQGETLYRHRADSTYLSPQFVPDQYEMPASAQQLLDSFVAALAPDPSDASTRAEPTRAQVIDGRRVLSRRIVQVWNGSVLQISAIDAPGGLVLVVGALPPGAAEASHEALLRSIEILD